MPEVTPGAAATTRPAGKASVKFTPVSTADAFGLMIVKVIADVAPGRIDDGEKFFASTGGARLCTASCALAELPVTAAGPVAATAPVVLTRFAAAVAVTLTRTRQLAPGSSACAAPATMLTELLPAVAPVASVRLHSLNRLGGLATTIVPGKVSLKVTVVRVTWFGLVSVIVSVETPFTTITVGEKSLAMRGGSTSVPARKVTVALAALPVSAVGPVAVTFPVVLVCLPAPPPVRTTSMPIVHEPTPAPTARPVKLNVVWPARGTAGAIVSPVQAPAGSLAKLVTGATCRPPVARLSFIAMPVRPICGLGLLTSISIRVTPPATTSDGTKDFFTNGGNAGLTVSTARAVLPLASPVAVTAPVVFCRRPVAVPSATTFTDSVQLPVAGMFPAVTLMLLLPAAPPVKVRPQVLDAETVAEATLGTAAIRMPAGKASVTLVTAATAALGLVIVKVSVDRPPTVTTSGRNALESTSGWLAAPVARNTTARFPVRATGPLEVMLLEVTLLVPAVVSVMLTLTVQLPPAGIVPPVTWMPASPATSAPPPLSTTVRPQGFTSPGPPGATTMPLPIAPVVNATPVSAVFAFGLVIVKVSTVAPLTAIAEGAKAASMRSGRYSPTVKTAEATLPMPPLVEDTVPEVLV